MRYVSAMIDRQLLQCTIPDTDSELVEEVWTALSREEREAQRRKAEWEEKRDALNAPPPAKVERVDEAGCSVAGVLLVVMICCFAGALALAISGIAMGHGGIR